MNRLVIVASGLRNGRERELHWSEVLPGCGGWASDLSRCRVYDDAATATENLATAKVTMQNPALDVRVEDLDAMIGGKP